MTSSRRQIARLSATKIAPTSCAKQYKLAAVTRKVRDFERYPLVLNPWDAPG